MVRPGGAIGRLLLANLGTPQNQYETSVWDYWPTSLLCRWRARRYMHQYGEDRTREAMANIAVSTRKWANMNEKAYFYDRPATFDDYHESRWIVVAIPSTGLLLGDGCWCGDCCDDS